MPQPEALCPLLTTLGGVCGWCGKLLTGRQQRWCSRKCAREFTANHRWTQARQAAKAAATFYQCAECGDFVRKVEVNHRKPIKGKHAQWGCHHHQDGLEVLCVPCHRVKTNEQRERGWQ